MEDNPETPPPEKAYCCGNSTQREASLISKFDMIISIVFFFIFLTFLIVLSTNPDYFTEVAKHAPGNASTDLSAFLQWPKATQLTVLSLLVFLHTIYIALSVLLLIASAKRHHKALLIWFTSTLIFYLGGFILTITTAVFLHDKVAMSISLIAVFLYKWYSVWIVKILMKEITSVAEGEVYGDGIEIGDTDTEQETAIPLDKF